MKKKTQKKLIVILIIFFISLFILFILNYKNKFSTEIIETINEASQSDTESEEYDIGEYAYVSNLSITETTTGTAPFDDEEETDSSNSDGTVTWTAGNDTSEDDNIVRSFDEITWNLSTTLSIKDDIEDTSFYGGTIHIVVSLPEECEDMVLWDTDEMVWAENISLSDDNLELTCEYIMDENTVTIPRN